MAFCDTNEAKPKKTSQTNFEYYYHLQMVVILKIGLAWFFWVWLRSYYKKPQKKHRNAKTEPFKVSYCFEDRRTTLKIGLACLFGFGFVPDTKTYGRNNDMRNDPSGCYMVIDIVVYPRSTLKIGLACLFGFGFVRSTKTYRRNTEMRKLSRSRHRYCFEDRRTTVKIGLACFFGFGFARNTKNHRRSTEVRKLSRSRPLHEHRYYFEDRRTTLKLVLAPFLGFGFVRNTKSHRKNAELRKLSRSRPHIALRTVAPLSKLVWLVF